MLLPKLAFRNLGRNARRSLIAGLALSLSLALCIAYYGLADGMNVQLVHSLTRYDLGHLQVHAEGWSKHRRLEATIPDAERVLAVVRRDPAVRAASARVYGAALTGAGAHSTGVELVGIDPRTETQVTELDRQLAAGRFLAAEPTPWPAARPLTEAERAEDEQITRAETRAAEDEIDSLGTSGQTPPRPAAGLAPRAARRESEAERARRLSAILAPRPERPPELVLGVSLARVLAVHPGDAVYLSTQAADGTMEGVQAKVAGIYETGTSTYDRTRMYLHIQDLQRLLHLGARVHEIAAVGDSPDDAPAAVARLRAELSSPSLDVRSWSELRPDLLRMLDLNRAGGSLLALIVFFVASLGVVNTMLMAVLERTREIGVLKAIGMSAGRIFAMIVAETAVLALGGAAAGTVLGLGLDLYLVRRGMDLTSLTRGFSFGGIGMEPVVRGAITPEGVIAPVVILTCVCLAAALYPAWRAARMQPAVGMRET
jgi:lipoprotein-releasing system permease protein